MFNLLVGMWLLNDGTYIVLRINSKDEYVTHKIGSGALRYARERNPVATEMGLILQAEGHDGHYFGSDYAMAMGDFCQRIMDAPQR